MKADNAPILHPRLQNAPTDAPTAHPCTYGRTHDAPICTYGCTHGTHRINSYALRNEKYKGDALLQKTFCEDFLTKKMKPNTGEVPQYYVENNHECCPYVNTFEPPQKARIYGIFRHSAFAHPSSEHLI